VAEFLDKILNSGLVYFLSVIFSFVYHVALFTIFTIYCIFILDILRFILIWVKVVVFSL